MRRFQRVLRPPRRQSGLALLLLVGVLGMGATYMMIRAFNEAALGNPRQARNALVLEEAKAALLMYVSAQVATETYPGKLPCPEDTSKIGTANEGQTQAYCTLPAVGRLPWKTLGFGQAPLDADDEQLWYAVSPGFNRANSGVSLTINSNTPAGLTVDGTQARAVALIISPGPGLFGQARRTKIDKRTYSPAYSSADPPLAANFLDDENATPDIKFITNKAATSVGGVSTVFNDQVAVVSHQDLFGVVEQAVARRLNDTMVTGTKPLTSIYASASWGASSAAPVFPYAASFGNPETSAYQGTSGKTQGLLPVTYSTGSDGTTPCTVSASDPRCNPTFVQWTAFQSISKQSGGMTLYSSPAPTCTVAASLLTCTIYTSTSGTLCTAGGLTIRVTATASNVAMALRQLDSTAPFLSGSGICSSGDSASAIINSDGSATVTFTGQVSNSGTTFLLVCLPASFTCQRRIFTIPIRIFQDHPIVNSGDTEYGWFTKNEWHKLTYYAIAPGFAASVFPPRSCTSASDCLKITNLSTTPTDNKRALLILAGRAIGTQSRPSSALSDYLESENASPVDITFITLKSSLQSNDRVVVVDTN